MASPSQWTWAWASSGRWWRTGKPGMLQSMGSQRVGHDWATEQLVPNFSKSQIGSSSKGHFVLSATSKRKANSSLNNTELHWLVYWDGQRGWASGSVPSKVWLYFLQSFLLGALLGSDFGFWLAFLRAAWWWSVAVGSASSLFHFQQAGGSDSLIVLS